MVFIINLIWDWYPRISRHIVVTLAEFAMATGVYDCKRIRHLASKDNGSDICLLSNMTLNFRWEQRERQSSRTIEVGFFF